MNFDAIKLYPGAVMQLQAKEEGALARHEVKFIGFIKDKCLLTTLPVKDEQGLWMRIGKVYVIRGFNGIHAYAFSSQVLRAHTHPFPYVHFSWPQKVECQLVRHSLRVNALLPANIVLADGSAVTAMTQDFSVSGTMLDSPAELGAVDDHIKIEFTVGIDDNAVPLNLQAIIRNINKKDDGTGYRVGIAFENVTQNDGLALHYFTHTLAQRTR